MGTGISVGRGGGGTIVGWKLVEEVFMFKTGRYTADSRQTWSELGKHTDQTGRRELTD